MIIIIIIIIIITDRIRSKGEGYAFTSICLSTGGGGCCGVSRGRGGGLSKRGGLYRGGGIFHRGGSPIFQKMETPPPYGNTVNAQSVHITLKCILLYNINNINQFFVQAIENYK